MGFYGNINNTTKVQFNFDRIFSSRTAMDDAVANGTDGVFAGRFVLVSYEKEVANFPLYYLNNGRIYDNRADAENEVHWISLEELRARLLHPNQTESYTPIIHVPVGYDLNHVDVAKYYFVTDDSANPLEEVTSDNANTYLINYLLDTRNYGNGRGYDGTVWQKMYAENRSYFAMVAELNSIVPTLGITVDAPTEIPKAPHFDVDTSNIYYKLHLQPTPGLWLRPAQGSRTWSTSQINYPSDVTYTYPLVNENGSANTQTDIAAAVYFNKAGFNPINITYAKDVAEDDTQHQAKNVWEYSDGEYIVEDLIELNLLTGKSGQAYGVDGSLNKTVQPDTNELVIMLPSIGDTMAQVWDLVYGGREVATLGMRNNHIEWEDAGLPQTRQGLRLTKELFGGIGYEQNEVNTVAGSINTMHDLIGMIIVNAADYDLEDEEVMETADSDKIYWQKEKYYRVGIEYDPQYDENDALQNLNPYPHFEETELNQPKNNTYFDKYGDNYLLIKNTSDFKKNKKYYEWSNLSTAFTVANVDAEEAYKKETYYYKVDGDYFLDTSDIPTPGRQYYKIPPNAWQAAANDRSVIWFATNRFYRQEMDITQTPPVPTGLMERDTSSQWSPGNDNDHYDLYLADRGTNADGSETDIIYKNVTNRVLKRDVGGPYYTKDEVNKAYHLVTEDIYRNIWSDDSGDEGTEGTAGEHMIDDIENISLHVYTLAGVDAVSLYAPGTYYYVDNWVETEDTRNSLEIIDDQGNQKRVIGNILQDKEIKKTLGRTYFTKEVDPTITENSFYIVNEYYLRDNNGAIQGDETPTPYHYSLSVDAWSDSATYYEKFDKHVINDSNNIFPVYYKWNPNIPVPYDTNTNTGVQLCWLKDKQVFEELEGYARDKNTLNGLLLETHKKFGAEDTRDVETVNGAINTLQDLTNNFATMKAGESVVVDSYGRMHSAKINNLDNKPNRNGGGDEWINLSISPDFNNPSITIEHLKKDTIITTAKSDTDLSTSTTAAVNLQDLAFDDMGHVNANQSHTYNLPYNFGEIQIDSDTTNIISPDNTYDKLTLTGDSWIQLTPDTANDTIAFTHIGPVTVAHQDKTDVSPAFGGSFEIEDWTFDTKGHKTSGGTHTITLPIGSYVNTPATTDATGVITGLGFTGSTGAITSTSNYLGAIQLGSYIAPSGGNGISTTSTLSDALATLDARIAAEETNRNNIITALDYTDTAVTDEVVTAVNQVDGLISVTRAAVFSNLSESSATPQLVTYNTKGLITGGSDLTWNTIKDFTVGTDANNAPVTLDDLVQYLLRIHGGALAKTLNSITVTPPTKTTYEDGEMLDLTGMTITGNYTKAGISSSELINSNDYTVSPSGGSTLSAANSPITVTVTYQGKSDTFNVVVNSTPIMTGIEITQEPTKQSYTDGETLDLTGLVVTASFSNASPRQLNTSEYVTDPVDGATLTSGDVTVLVSVPNTEFTDSFTVHVV